MPITEKESLDGTFLNRLGYAWREVRQSLNRSLSRYLPKDSTRHNPIHDNDFVMLVAGGPGRFNDGTIVR